MHSKYNFDKSLSLYMLECFFFKIIIIKINKFIIYHINLWFDDW